MRNYREDDAVDRYVPQLERPQRWAITFAIVALLILVTLIALPVSAAVTITEDTQVTLLRSGSCYPTGKCTHPSWVACQAVARQYAQADTRTSGTVTYTCQTERRRLIASYTACGLKPADETQQAQCPAGAGTWPQLRTYISAPAPTCWTASAWTPAIPPAGACTPVDTEPPLAPASASAVGTSATQITLSWAWTTDNVQVTGNIIEGCRGATCITFAEVWRGSSDTLQYLHNTVAGATWRYRVRAYDAAGNVSEPSPIAMAKTLQPTVGAATLQWTAPTKNTDGTALTNLAGYRIHYGTSATALTQSIQIPGNVSSYVVEGLPPGTYYFAVRAYTSGGTESDPSNIASKSVQ